MKVIVIGLGSMGKRRIGNLKKQANVTEIRGFDLSADRRAEAREKTGVDTFDTMVDALAWGPDAAVISTPPKWHTPVCMEVAEAGIPFFVEASVIDDGLDKLIALLKKKKVVGVPSCTMRFHPQLKQLHKMLHEDKILGDPTGRLAFSYHMGQYLPDWHPHEDYRKFYVSDSQTSATREMVCFENVWLSWLFGPPMSVDALKAKISDLDADIDDVFQLLMEYGTGTTGSMLIDVVSRTPYRALRIISEDGVIEWSAVDNVFRFHDGTKWTDYAQRRDQGYAGGNFTGEEMYVEEIRSFLAAVNGNRAAYPYSFEEDRLILSVLRGADESAATGMRQIPSA